MKVPEGIRVRPGKLEDLPSIARHYAHGDSPWDPFGDVSKLSRIPLDGLLLVEVQGTYAGFLYWFEGRRPYFDPNVDRYANLQELHILEPFRGKGLSKVLIERFLSDARERGIRDAFVDTDDDNTIAQHLYESFGFTLYRKVFHYRLRLDDRSSQTASR
jgi:ribosomal protein S18 acetylase RimI-like enzyme